MSEVVKMEFCELSATPLDFNKEKFLAEDKIQINLYKNSKHPNRNNTLTYEDITTKKEKPNYARVVPKGCMFLDFDTPHEFMRMKEIIIKSKLKCLILESPHGGHFMFRKPSFYKKEMTKATNWFGYKFDTKGAGAVQIMRVCGMERKEMRSWDLKEVILKEFDIEELDVLPYWLWGKLKDKDLHKSGKPGDSEYHLDDTPFTQLMTMGEGERHNHIFSKCSMFALQNGFTIKEFKTIIQIIHDVFLTKIGSAMSDSDLFSDLEDRWNEYIETMTSSGWTYKEKERLWKKAKSKKSEKISEQEACELLYNKYDFYVIGNNNDTGEGGQLCYIASDLTMLFDLNIMWKEIRDIFCEHSFKTIFYEEVKKQLIQRCNEDKKIFYRNSKFYACKNGIASCISDDIYPFDYLKKKNITPTDLIYDWNLHNRKWVEEHTEDLGRTYY